MGGVGSICGENIFEQLQQKYGGDFAKFIAAEKGKEVVQDKFSGFVMKSHEIFGDFENKTNTIVDQKSQTLKDIFDGVKAKVDSAVPGGIPAIERLKGASINDISGYSQIVKNIDGIKKDTIGKINVQKNNVINQLDNKKTGMIRKIDEEKPQVPLYDQLPQRVKSSILEQGEKTFTEQVTNNKDAITNQALKAFNQDKILGMFTELNPEGILQNIIGGAGTQFLSNLGLGGSIGGMASNLGGLANNFGISNPFSNFM